MLKVPYRKLRPNSKGGLNKRNRNNLLRNQHKSKLQIANVGRKVLQGIPVLSIFALVGIVSASISVSDLDNLSFDADNYKAYAAETGSTGGTSNDNGITPLADTSASLTIDDGKIKDTIFATNGEFAYATHKVSINATNIKSYTLTLAKTAGLTGPSTVNDAGTGVTPANMDNQWGYAWINENDDPTTATYKTLSTANNLADIAIDSNHNVNASKQLVFGAKFGSSAASGTYHAEATLSLVAAPRVITNYVVNVNCNSGTNCTTPLNTTSDNETYTYTISSTTPTRSGYKFLGYNTTNSTTANTNYAPGKAITLTAATPTLNLYAIWQEDIKTIKTITTMQEMYTGNDNGVSSICAASTTDDTNTLTDTRDDSTYTVKKLANGQCWMAQNLRIVGKTVSSTDSDMTSGSVSIPSTASNFVGTNKDAAYYGNNVTYGAYYSWYTATAHTGTGSMTSGDASSSICPKGWKLPKGSTTTYTAASFKQSAGMNDFTAALNYTGTLSASTNAYSALGNPTFSAGYTVNGLTWPAAGYYYSASFYDGGVGGYYWSRTVNASDSAYNFYLYRGGIHPATNDYKYRGLSVRCVAYSS